MYSFLLQLSCYRDLFGTNGSPSSFRLAYSLACTVVSRFSFEKGEYLNLQLFGIVSDAALLIGEFTSLLIESTSRDVISMSLSSLSDVALYSSHGTFLKFHRVFCSNIFLHGVVIWVMDSLLIHCPHFLLSLIVLSL